MPPSPGRSRGLARRQCPETWPACVTPFGLHVESPEPSFHLPTPRDSNLVVASCLFSLQRRTFRVFAKRRRAVEPPAPGVLPLCLAMCFVPVHTHPAALAPLSVEDVPKLRHRRRSSNTGELGQRRPALSHAALLVSLGQGPPAPRRSRRSASRAGTHVRRRRRSDTSTSFGTTAQRVCSEAHQHAQPRVDTHVIRQCQCACKVPQLSVRQPQPTRTCTDPDWLFTAESCRPACKRANLGQTDRCSRRVVSRTLAGGPEGRCRATKQAVARPGSA